MSTPAERAAALLRRSLPRRLDMCAEIAARAGGTFELIQRGRGDYVAMILPRDGAAVTGAGSTCSRATLALVDELERLELEHSARRRRKRRA